MLATTLVAFLSFKTSLERRHVAALDQYVTERAMREDRQFSTLAELQKSAVEALTLRRARLTDTDVVRLFDAAFTPRPDGTRRTDDALFDGRQEANGDYLYGLAGFIPHPSRLTLDEKRTLVAALPVVARFGESASSFYDNFYFFTPQTRLVMFGPKRADRLMFYRSAAPADVDVSQTEMARIATLAGNPQRRPRCTSLQHLISDAARARTGVSCILPVDVSGRHVGAFGSSLQLGGYFQRAMGHTPPGLSAMIIGADGRLIAYPGVGSGGPVPEERVFAVERAYGLATVSAAIRARGGDHGVVKSPGGKQIIAFGRLRGPGWYYLIASPASAVALDAARSAAWVLALGLLAVVLQTAAVVLMAKRIVVGPVALLAQSAASDGDRPPTGRAAGALERRPDEIGILARALRTERETVASVLGSLEDRVKDRTVELQAALQEKSRFLANMSHELRTPLNGVIAVSDVLLARAQTPQDRDLLQLIANSGLVPERVLSDVLDAAKLEAGHVQLETLAFDPRALVQQAGELHSATAQEKGLSISVTIAAEVADYYSGDPLRLTQILNNLLNNAVKFTEAGGVAMEVSTSPGGLCFEVSDTGVGFDAAAADRLFTPFEQADATITRRFGGTGLGLSICRSLAQLMGGTVSAHPNTGGGARFRLDLPLVPIEAPTVAAVEPAAVDPLAGARVLLAEDHPTNQRVVQLILESAGVMLQIVPDGALALEALAMSRFDVILMDMQMPVMDGLSATRAIRSLQAQGRIAPTPIIMLTANAMREHVDAAHAAGADSLLAKPFRPQEIIAAVSMAIRGPPEAIVRRRARV